MPESQASSGWVFPCWFESNLDLFKGSKIMNKPISAGDLAVVTSGLLEEKSPNIGLIVKVVSYVGDEITLGRIWRCEVDYGQRLVDNPKIPGGYLDFAQSWLKRIDPPPLPVKEKKKECVS
jgi:hypothetical protein